MKNRGNIKPMKCDLRGEICTVGQNVCGRLARSSDICDVVHCSTGVNSSRETKLQADDQTASGTLPPCGDAKLVYRYIHILVWLVVSLPVAASHDADASGSGLRADGCMQHSGGALCPHYAVDRSFHWSMGSGQAGWTVHTGDVCSSPGRVQCHGKDGSGQHLVRFTEEETVNTP